MKCIKRGVVWASRWLCGSGSNVKQNWHDTYGGFAKINKPTRLGIFARLSKWQLGAENIAYGKIKHG